MRYENYGDWLKDNEEWFKEKWYKEDCDCVSCSRYRWVVKNRGSKERTNNE